MSLKAFELVQVLDHVQLGGEKSKSTVESIECSMPELYVGTNDCFVIHFLIEQTHSPSGKSVFRSKLQRHKHLGQRKPISALVACPAVSILLCLCDGAVYMLSMHGLELKVHHGVKEILKGVSAITRNDTSNNFTPNSVEICVATKRKQINLYSVDEDKVQMLTEISVSDIPRAIAADGQTICTVLDNQYYLIDTTTNQQQSLFMHEANTTAMIKRIGKEEFLLSGPTDSMGMIVSAEGLSKHQPLSWADGVVAVAYSYPYVLILGNTTVTIHSMLDKQQKQAIGFLTGVTLNDFDGLVLVAAQRAVFSLVAVPLDQQIQMLLLEKRVQEALELSIVGNGVDSVKFGKEFLNRVNIQAGFVQFAQGQFSSCSQLFAESHIDPREVIALYPSLLPSDTIFVPSRPLLHNIKDIQSMARGSKTLLAEAKKFLLDFLERNRHDYSAQKKDMDTALVKLYAECAHAKLPEFVAQDSHCHPADAKQALSAYKRWHALALFNCCHNEKDKALTTWIKLLQNELQDVAFPGLSFLVNLLAGMTEGQLVWRYAGVLLDIDQTKAVKIFTERSSSEQTDLQHEAIVDFLGRYSVALTIFLEHLIFNKTIDKEKFHTHLAMIYLDQVLQLLKDRIHMPDKIAEARTRLQAFLEYSSLFRISTLLARIGESKLHLEVSILYGKLDQHDKALDILVHELNDYAAAERHCEVSSKGMNEQQRSRLYTLLLSMYLEPTNKEMKDKLIIPAVDLINNHNREFDPVQVMGMLPGEWSVGLVSKFLTGSLRKSVCNSRLNKVDKALRRGLYIKSRYAFVSCTNGGTSITDDSVCHVCKKLFTEPIMVRYPNGVLAHNHCARDRNVCPLTGKDFSKLAL